MQLVDASVWIHFLRTSGNEEIRESLKPRVLSGTAAVTEWTILELMVGLRSSERAGTLLGWMRDVPRLSFPSEAWSRVWYLAARLRKRGVSASAPDCLVATVAMAHDVPLIHCDADFEDIAKHCSLRTVDWTIFLKK